MSWSKSKTNKEKEISKEIIQEEENDAKSNNLEIKETKASEINDEIKSIDIGIMKYENGLLKTSFSRPIKVTKDIGISVINTLSNDLIHKNEDGSEIKFEVPESTELDDEQKKNKNTIMKKLRLSINRKAKKTKVQDEQNDEFDIFEIKDNYYYKKKKKLKSQKPELTIIPEKPLPEIVKAKVEITKKAEKAIEEKPVITKQMPKLTADIIDSLFFY